jgi:hypothetical protein
MLRRKKLRRKNERKKGKKLWEESNMARPVGDI